MTKKDYIKMADQFRDAINLNKTYCPPDCKTTVIQTIEAIVRDFAVMLHHDNSKFNVDRWNKYIFG